LSKFQKYHPSGNLKFSNVGIFQNLKLRNLMREKLSIALKLKIIPNTLGCYRLSALYPAPPNFRMKHGTQAVGNATFEVYSDRSSGQIGCHSKQIRSAASARCRRPRLLGFRGLLSIKQSSFKKKNELYEWRRRGAASTCARIARTCGALPRRQAKMGPTY